jgi:hypothetical protein
MVDRDSKSKGRVNIQRQHGRLKSTDKTELLKDTSKVVVTIQYCTYGSFLPSIKPEAAEDLLVLDEIHTRNSADVIATEVAIQECGRFKNVVAMTATSWAPSEGNDFYIDYSIGTSKRYPIDEKIIKRFDEVPAGEASSYYKILGVDKNHYALPREACAGKGKTLVFMSSINECSQGMKDLLQTNPGVTVMTLTSINRDEPVPDGQVVIFATDIAESGVTIPNCDNVVDFRRSMKPVVDLTMFNNEKGQFSCSYDLQKVAIDICSATQRKGRTGRTCPGTYWTCDTERLPPMVDRPIHSTNEAILQLLKNNYIRDLCFKGEDFFNENIMQNVKILHPATMSQKEHFRPISASITGNTDEEFARVRVSPEVAHKRLITKLNTMQCVRYVDAITWYMLPNIPRSWIENGRIEKLCGGDIANVEKTKECIELVKESAIDEDCWRKMLSSSSCEVTIPLTLKMDAKDWHDADENIRESYRNEAFTGIKCNSSAGMDAFYWGGGGTLVVVAATGLLFGQFWEVLYGKKVPSDCYQLEKDLVRKAVQCFEYLNTEKLTKPIHGRVGYWAASCANTVEKAVRICVNTLPDNNPLKMWFNSANPPFKCNSGGSDIWTTIIEKLQYAWDSFQATLPINKDELLKSWFGSGALSVMGTFYDNWCEELTPFGAFLIMVGFGSVAAAICSVPQFIGSCIVGGMGYLIAHWLSGPSKGGNKYLSLEIEKRRRNRFFQMEIGSGLGGLITYFLVPLMQGNVAAIVAQTIGTYGSTATLTAANAGASAGAAAAMAVVKDNKTLSGSAQLVGGFFEQSTTAKVYDMYMHMQMVWSGKIDMYSADGIGSIMTMFGGMNALASFDIAAFLTLGIAASVDWMCDAGVKGITDGWYRNYGNLKPGESVGKLFVDGSEEEKERKVEKLKTIRTIIHCAIGSGLNPMCIIPAILHVCVKKVYEGPEQVTTDELIQTYQKSVTTHPVALAMQAMWSISRRLRQASDFVTCSEDNWYTTLTNIKDTLCDVVKELAEGVVKTATEAWGKTSTMRRYFGYAMKMIFRLVEWVFTSITNKIKSAINGVVDAAVRSVVQQLVPTFWLRWCAKEGPVLDKPDKSSDVSLIRYFHLYGLKHLIELIPSICDSRLDCEAQCPWEVKNFRDHKLWKLMQHVALNDNANEMAVILRSLKIDKTNRQGWFSTRYPSEVLKYMVSVLAYQVSQTVDLMGDEILRDQLINGVLHFSQFYNESYSCTIIRSADLRQAFILLNTENAGIVFSWKWHIPESVRGILKGYTKDLVPHQDSVFKTLMEVTNGSWTTGILNNTELPTLPDSDWDAILHDIAFSQADVFESRYILFAANNITPLDFELSKLNTHEKRFNCVINHFNLAKRFVFKGLEQTCGWRSGISDEFDTRKIKAHERAGGKPLSIGELQHCGANYGTACFALRMIHIDLGVKDLVAWVHLVTGLPAVCEVVSFDETELVVCDTFSKLDVKKPYVEARINGFLLHNENKKLIKRNHKLVSLHVNSLRKVDSNKEWHRLLAATRNSSEIIYDTGKFSVVESSYFSCLKQGKRFTHDEEVADNNRLCIMDDSKRCTPDMAFNQDPSEAWISNKPLYRVIGGRKVPISFVSGKTSVGKVYISISALLSSSVHISFEMEDVEVSVQSNFQFKHEEIINLINNGFTHWHSDHIAVNLERRSWVRIDSPYAEVLMTLSNNVYPWVGIKTNPALCVQRDVLKIAENPDWVFTAMNAPNRASPEHVQQHAEIFKESLQRFLNDLDDVTDGFTNSTSLLIKERDDDESFHGSYHVGIINDLRSRSDGEGEISDASVYRSKIEAGPLSDNTIDLNLIKDKYSLKKLEITPAAMSCEVGTSNFLKDMATDQGLSGKGSEKLDPRTLKDRALASRMVKAQETGQKIVIQKHLVKRKTAQVKDAVESVKDTATRISDLSRAVARVGVFGKLKQVFTPTTKTEPLLASLIQVQGEEGEFKCNGQDTFVQVLVDALTPSFWRDLPTQRPRHERVELEYMQTLERYQKNQLDTQGESSTGVAEAMLNERMIAAVIENQQVIAEEDIERVLQDDGYVVHFSNVSERGMPSLPFVGNAFASVRASQEISKTHEQKYRELVTVRKSEVLPIGLPVKPLRRTQKVPHPGVIPMELLQSALKSIDHIENPIYDALAGYNRVFKPKNTDLGTVSRGWPKVQLMDRDLGLWSASSTVYEMTAGFGGYSEYFTHCPRLKTIVDGKVMSEDGRVRTLVFSNLVLPGHATAVVDHILNHEEMAKGKLRVRRLIASDGTGTNGDLRDSRLLELTTEAAETYPPELMVFDAGEDSPDLMVEANWQCKKLGMTADLREHAFCETYGEAVQQYLPLVAQGGSAVIKMFGFTDQTVDLVQAYSKGFQRLLCYKNPSTTLVSREWYLVLLGRDQSLDEYVQFIKDKQGNIRRCKPSEVLSSDMTELKYYMYRNKTSFWDFSSSGDTVADIRRKMKNKDSAQSSFLSEGGEIQADFDFGNLIMTLRLEWNHAFNRFASWAREVHNAVKLDFQKFGNKNMSLGSGQIYNNNGDVIESRVWTPLLDKIRNEHPRITLDNAVRRAGYNRRFCVPRYYTSFTTPKGDWKAVKPGMSDHVADNIIMRRKLAGPDFESIDAGFEVFGEKFESRISTRVNMLKSTVIKNGYKVTNPTNLFENVAEPFGISFKQLFGKEKHISNMLLFDMCHALFGQDNLSSVVGHTQCTSQFLHASWKKRLDIAMKEPSPADADLLRQSMEAIKTPECKRIENGPEKDKFSPWTYEQACEEVHKQGKGGHFDKYVDFGSAIRDPQFRVEVEERMAMYSAGMATPTYQVCRDKRETKAKKNIIADGHLVLNRPDTAYDPRSKLYKRLGKQAKYNADKERKKELEDASSIAPRNIRFAEFVQRFCDLMMLGPVQKHHAHIEKLYYGSSTGTPLWRLGGVTKGLHDVYAPTHQQEYWKSSGLKDIPGDSARYQDWFDKIMNGKTKGLKENVYIRMYDPSFRKGMERRAIKTLIASGDFSGFDGTVSKTDLVLNYLFYKSIYQQDYHTMLKTRWEHWMWALVITDHGNVIVSDGQRSSGDQDTSFGNTMINSIYHYMSTALALGISIKEAVEPIGEVWFKSDFDHNSPKYKRLYLQRISHISDGDDNLHFGTAQDIELFDKNGPPFLERCGKKIRCGTRSGYQISEQYSGLSYCSHSYVRTRKGSIDSKPIGVYPRSLYKTDESDLTRQHDIDINLGLRVEYLPARPIPEIVGKLVFTMKAVTSLMDLKRYYGEGKKEENRGRKNEDAIAITRGKVLSYLLNYAQYSVVRILCMSALSIIGDDVCDLTYLKKRYNVPSSTKSIASALKGVFGIDSLREIETINPEIERKGLRVMRDNAYLRYATLKLDNYGEICPTSLGVLHDRARSWIENYGIKHDIFPDYYYWHLADPNAIVEDTRNQTLIDYVGKTMGVGGSDDGTHGGRLLPNKTRMVGKNQFLANLWGTLLSLSLLGGDTSHTPKNYPEMDENAYALSSQFRDTPEMIKSYDVIVEASADAKNLGVASDLYPGLKSSIKHRIDECNSPSEMVGRAFFVENRYQRVYVIVTKEKSQQTAKDDVVRQSLNHVGKMADDAASTESRQYGRSAANRRRNLLVLSRRGKIGNSTAKYALQSCGSRTVKSALFVIV